LPAGPAGIFASLEFDEAGGSMVPQASVKHSADRFGKK
jgi:hypothetical protein